MKDITKGDILNAIDAIIPCLKHDRSWIAQRALPQIQNWEGGYGGVAYNMPDGKLMVDVRIMRQPAQQRKARKEWHDD